MDSPVYVSLSLLLSYFCSCKFLMDSGKFLLDVSVRKFSICTLALTICRPRCFYFTLQVAAGLSFTVILTRQGHVYTCGSNTHGQLGLGDTLDRPTPRKVASFEGLGHVVQIAAGASYTFAVTKDGTVHSFGSCSNFCLGHGDQHDEFLPRAIQSFKKRNIHVVRVSAGDEHAVALDSSGHVSLLSIPMN